MTNLQELIERVERASGPDRELDAYIRCAVFARPGAFVRQSTINGAWCIFEIRHDGKERLWEPYGLSQLQRLGEFTASLDAAMTLVPDGCAWAVTNIDGGDYSRFDFDKPTAVVQCRPGAVMADHVSAATPALALSAASLKARLNTEGEV